MKHISYFIGKSLKHLEVDMLCPCGAETHNQIHEVKTIEKAKEWFPLIKSFQLPIKVDQEKCPSCKRMLRSIYFDGKLIHRKGQTLRRETMIEIEIESKEWLACPLIEDCIICGEKTRFWNKENNKPVCEVCGINRGMGDLYAAMNPVKSIAPWQTLRRQKNESFKSG